VNVPDGTLVSSQLMADPGSGVVPVPQAALVVVPSERATVKLVGAELSGVVGCTHVTCTVRTFGFGMVAVTLVGAFNVRTAPEAWPVPVVVKNAQHEAAMPADSATRAANTPTLASRAALLERGKERPTAAPCALRLASTTPP